MKRRLVLVQHDRGPRDDRVSTFGTQNGFDLDYRHPFDGETLGDLDEGVAGCIVFGGRFEAYAHGPYPFLRDEARWIEACMRQSVPLLGICLGAQQIAHTLGAEVGPPASGLHEFGYYEVTPTEAGREVMPGPLHLSQAHFHTFGLPAGAEHLASSAMYPNQAFRYGATTYGFQFHAEVTIEGFRRWQRVMQASYGRPGVQTRDEQDRLMLAHDAAQADWFYGFLGRLFGRAA